VWLGSAQHCLLTVQSPFPFSESLLRPQSPLPLASRPVLAGPACFRQDETHPILECLLFSFPVPAPSTCASLFFFPFDLLDARSLKPPFPSLVLGPSLKGVLLAVHRRQSSAATQPTTASPTASQSFGSAALCVPTTRDTTPAATQAPGKRDPTLSIAETKEAFAWKQLPPFNCAEFSSLSCTGRGLWILVSGTALSSVIPKPTPAVCAPPRRQSLGLRVFCAATTTLLLFGNQLSLISRFFVLWPATL
jgi:hypothetical protein